MKIKLIAGIALGATLGMSGFALAQPAYGPNATYYPGYASPPPAMVTAPPPSAYYAPGWDGTHTNGGAARAYSYSGAQKSN